MPITQVRLAAYPKGEPDAGTWTFTQDRLSAVATEGVDVYFDNVGGEILDAVRGPSNYLQLIAQSAVMQGFTMRDYIRRIPEAFVQLLQWSAAGQLVFREHVLEGIENFPRAFGMLFRGENHGKLLLRVRDEAAGRETEAKDAALGGAAR